MPTQTPSTGPKPTLVLLVRHGATPTTGKILPGRAPGLHLSEKGRAQAEEVARAIAGTGRPPTAVYASPLERTRETAGFIGRALGVRVRTRQELLECDTGDWTGSHLRRITRTRAWKTVHAWPSGFRFPGGESFSEMATRAEGAVVRLAEAHPGDSIVVVSHADPIKAVVASAAGAPLDLFQRFVISPCSVSAILYSTDGPHVLCVNAAGPPGKAELS